MPARNEKKTTLSDILLAIKRRAQAAVACQKAKPGETEHTQGAAVKLMSAAERNAERARRRDEMQRGAIERALKQKAAIERDLGESADAQDE